MEILIKNSQKIKKINQKEIKKLIKKILVYEGYRNKEISILFTDNKYIQELNTKYRKLNKPTNVLSFSMEDEKLLGDIVISVEFAKAEAEKLGYSFEEELNILLIHGLLQLLGYNHKNPKDKKIMEEKKCELLLLVQDQAAMSQP